MNQRWQDAKLPDAKVPRIRPGMTYVEVVRALVDADCLTVVGTVGCETREDYEDRMTFDGCHCGNGFCE